MIDFSFIRYKPTLEQAMNIGDSPTATHLCYDMIALSPNEAYCQITNVDGGLSFEGDYEAYIIDCNGIELQDITNHVFIEEFSSNGVTQCKIEYINLGTDYYKKTVLIKLVDTTSDAVYYSNPLTISDYRIWETSYFQYKNYEDFQGIGYINAQCWQSIRIRTYFDIPIDETEVENYYQISRNYTVSARALIKKYEQYRIDYINRFTYERLNILLKHDLIYINTVRITDKPTAESTEREGDSNYFLSNFIASLNYNDTLTYEYQIFEGLILTSKIPHGNYTLATLGEEIKATFNSDIIINTGTLSVYDENNDLVVTFTEADIDEYYANGFFIENLLTHITTNGDYYILFDNGLISNTFGIDYEGISNPNVWTFSVIDAQYDADDYNNEYLT